MSTHKICFHGEIRKMLIFFVEKKKAPCLEVSLQITIFLEKQDITKTCLYNFDPLKPHFYIVKLGFTGVYIIFLISAQKQRLWVLVRTTLLRQF